MTTMNRTDLHYAIVDNKTEKAKELIFSGKVDLNAQDDSGYTALHFAAQYKKVEIVELLLNKRANINLLDAWGNTALWRSLGPSDENKKIIKMLLESGIDPCLKNKSGVSVVDHVKKITIHPNRDIFEKYFCD